MRSWIAVLACLGGLTAAGQDPFKDPLPEGAVLRIGSSRFQHGHRACGIALSPDGKLLATGDPYGAVRLWDTRTGLVSRKLDGHRAAPGCLAFSPDGRMLASGDAAGVVLLWDPGGGVQLRSIQAHAGAVGVLMFSRDGKSLATGGADRILRVWDPATGTERVKIEGAAGLLAWSPDGKILASTSVGSSRLPYDLLLWDAQTGKELERIKGRFRPVSQVVFPDAKSVAFAGGTYPFCWREIGTGRALVEIQMVRAEPADMQAIGTLYMTPDGKTLALAYRGANRFWDITSRKETSSSIKLPSGLCTPDWKVATSLDAYDRTIRVWDVATGNPLAGVERPASRISAVAWSPDGAVLATVHFAANLGKLGGDRAVRLWEFPSGKQRLEITGEKAAQGRIPSTGLRFLPDGSTLTVMNQGTFQFWDAASGRELSRLAALALSPDGKVAVSADRDGVIFVIERATARKLLEIEAHDGAVVSAAFSPDGKIFATGGKDQSIRLWDAASGKRVAAMSTSSVPVAALMFSPDGTLVASISCAPRSQSTAVLQVWDAAAAAQVFTLSVPVEGEYFCRPAFSPDGRWLVVGAEEGSIHFIDTVRKQEAKVLAEHGGPVNGVAFSPDGKWLASGSDDNTALVWDLQKLKLDAGAEKR